MNGSKEAGIADAGEVEKRAGDKGTGRIQTRRVLWTRGGDRIHYQRV